MDLSSKFEGSGLTIDLDMLRSLEHCLVSCWCGCSQILFVSEHSLLMMYVVRVLNLKVFQIGMLGFYWFLHFLECSCHLGHDTCSLQMGYCFP